MVALSLTLNTFVPTTYPLMMWVNAFGIICTLLSCILPVLNGIFIFSYLMPLSVRFFHGRCYAVLQCCTFAHFWLFAASRKLCGCSKLRCPL